MRLKPVATVSVVYSEIMRSEVKAPKFSVIDGCVFNQVAKGGTLLGGEAEVYTLTPHQVAMLAYIEYRTNAVESS
jgi:hypothetical protein